MKITLLAVTRMKDDRICIAGINEKGGWIRPNKKYPEYLVEEDITNKRKVIYAPFNIINIPYEEYKMLEREPHSEDCEIDDYSKISVIDSIPEKDREKYLLKYIENDFFKNCEDMGEVLIKKNRSLILVGPVEIGYVAFKKDKHPRIRFKIKDDHECEHSLPCPDIKFIELGESLLGNEEEIVLSGKRLKEKLKFNEVYLSLGLSREYKEKFHLMVIGVHTIPDYKL